MNQEQAEKIAAGYFGLYPAEHKAFITSDGQAFFKKNDAHNHSTSFSEAEDRVVYPVDRDTLRQAQSDTLRPAYAKAPAGKQAQSDEQDQDDGQAQGDEGKKPNAKETIALINAVEDIGALEAFQEGEERKSVLDAIDKKRQSFDPLRPAYAKAPAGKQAQSDGEAPAGKQDQSDALRPAQDDRQDQNDKK